MTVNPAALLAQFRSEGDHQTALVHMASSLLRSGDPHAALMFADRLVRITPEVNAQRYLLRSECARLAGFSELAAEDARAALEEDPTDPLIRRTVLAHSYATGPIANPELEDEGATQLVQRRPSNSPTVRQAERSDRLTVILPVHGDPEATLNCLASLRRQARRNFDVLVVEDATPHAELAAALASEAAQGWMRLVTLEANSGFAGAVNAGLALCAGDVVLLNSDTLVPPGALERLARIAHSDPSIGTVTPLSNNGEFTSFPEPFVANPCLDLSEADAFDELAARVNGDETVDLPTGIGFCLFIKASARNAAGPLPTDYGAGYLEDADYCHRIRQLGFRNVCATGVYVAHVGNSSFGASKRPLVVHNGRILALRFPAHSRECRAFVRADPLAPSRARLEAAAMPAPFDGVIVLGPDRQAASDAADRAEGDSGETWLAWPEATCLRVARRGGGIPNSLRFRLSDSGLDEFGDYLSKVGLQKLVAVRPASHDPRILDRLTALARRREWLITTPAEMPRRWPRAPNRDGSGQPGAHERFPSARQFQQLRARFDAITAADRRLAERARSVLGRAVPIRSNPTLAVLPDPAPEPREARLGIILPKITPATQGLLIGLSRAFLQVPSSPIAIVLGQTANDLSVMASGCFFVSGAIPPAGYARAVKQYRPSHLLLADSNRDFDLLESLSRTFDLPAAFFDSSDGRLSISRADLRLDLRKSVESLARSIAAWLEVEVRSR